MHAICEVEKYKNPKIRSKFNPLTLNEIKVNCVAPQLCGGKYWKEILSTYRSVDIINVYRKA